MPLFAKCKMDLGNGVEVLPNQKIPEGALKKGADKELIARGLAMEVDPLPVAKPVPVPDPGSKPSLEKGNWAFDPKTIEKDPLDMLNMKIAGHVQKYGLAKVQPFEDAAEARAFMSLEWPSA